MSESGAQVRSTGLTRLCAAAVLLVTTGCGTAPEADEVPEYATSPGASPSSDAADDAPTEGTADPNAVADIEAMYRSYWAAVVTARRELNTDPAQFEGLVLPGPMEAELHVVRNYIKGDLRQVGRPGISRVNVEIVDADQALVASCMDYSTWPAEYQGKRQPTEESGPTPVTFHVEKVQGAWLLGEVVPQEKADQRC